MSELILRRNGGVLLTRAGGDPADPADAEWNFGVTGRGSPGGGDAVGLHQRFPGLAGRWDGKTQVNHHEAARRVLGADIKAQQQPAGTCGGRAGSRGLELLQCVLVASGKRAKFRYVSHAWLYYLARREYGMLGRGDGVAGGSVPEVMAKYGCLGRGEAGDPEQAGPRSDDIARRWGAGKMAEAEEARLLGLASDNLVTAMVRCGSAQECADGLASGGVIVQSDGQGYEMTRDSEGVCRAVGRWGHYQVRSGVRVTPSGRKVFDYNQSWGEDTPDGPALPGTPGNCFGVEWDVQDRLCREGEVHCLFGFDLWDLEKGSVDLDWVF